MSLTVDTLLKENKFQNAVQHCCTEKDFALGALLCRAWKYRNIHSEACDMLEFFVKQLNSETSNLIRVRVTCNWCDSQTLCACWNKMSENGEGRWQNIQLVSEDLCDYLVVVNKPNSNEQLLPNKKRIIVFRMEPNMENEEHKWQEWAKPNKDEFLFVGYHSEHYNNNEWHLAKTYAQLSSEPIVKDPSLEFSVSTVLSSKYNDLGHIRRIDFAKYMENNGIDLHVFGDNKFRWKNYKGPLPYHNKNDGLLPYKYTYNVENQFINGYYTEKLIDGILAECLVFYRGPLNMHTFIDDRAYVYLPLGNFENDCLKIKEAIKIDLWQQRLPYIREAKQRILNEKSFFPRLKGIIDKSIIDESTQ